MAGAFLLLCASGTIAPASAEEGGITVAGVGRVEVQPDTVSFEGDISGEAELAADAIVKYRDNRRRIEEALQALNMEQLSVAWQGIRITGSSMDAQAVQMARMRGQVVPDTVGQVAINDTVALTIKGIDKLESKELLELLVRIVDTAKDAGMSLKTHAAGTAMAEFSLSRPDAGRSKAYEEAMKDAGASAGRLAKLSGTSLGGVISIEEIAAREPGNNSPQQVFYNPYGVAVPVNTSENEFTAPALKKIPIVVSLRVRYALAGKE